jgi:hypothetical protein
VGAVVDGREDVEINGSFQSSSALVDEGGIEEELR